MTIKMNKNIQQLLEKIYKEGVEDAELKRKEIITKSKEEAQEIISAAKNKSKRMIEEARKEAADIKQKNEAEMRLSSRQALGALKQKIADLLIWKITEEPVENAFNDSEFIKSIIEKIIHYWITNFNEEERLHIRLPESDFEDLQLYFRSKAQELLQKGIVVEYTGQMKDGFQISPDDGRFKVNFTSEDFDNYFKTFAKSSAFKLLFGD